MRYVIVIHKDKTSDYGVIVPDLPGCFSAGETMEAAMANAVEAIECHLEGLLLDGGDIPAARSVEAHLGNQVHAGGIWALVNVDLLKLATGTKRVKITLPERVLALADEQAERESDTRSNLLARAIMEYVWRHKT